MQLKLACMVALLATEFSLASANAQVMGTVNSKAISIFNNGRVKLAPPDNKYYWNMTIHGSANVTLPINNGPNTNSTSGIIDIPMTVAIDPFDEQVEVWAVRNYGSRNVKERVEVNFKSLTHTPTGLDLKLNFLTQSNTNYDVEANVYFEIFLHNKVGKAMPKLDIH